jgi:hypothetical protein
MIKKNIPPWLYLKNEQLMLALIVMGRIQVKMMVIYLQPLIDEFKQLWEGLHVYDVSIPIQMERSFTLYGICEYTTHNYPRLGVFSTKHILRFVYISNFIWHTLFDTTIFLTLTCYVYDNIAGLVTKGCHGCKFCGPSITFRWSNHLRNSVYDCSRLFLPEDHTYIRIIASYFNGKLERNQCWTDSFGI